MSDLPQHDLPGEKPEADVEPLSEKQDTGEKTEPTAENKDKEEASEPNAEKKPSPEPGVPKADYRQASAPPAQTYPSSQTGLGSMIAKFFAGKLAIPVLIGVAVVLLVLFLINSIFGSFSGLFGLVNRPTSASINSSQTVLTGIQPLGQLVSISLQLAQADVNVNVGQGALNACGFSVNHVVQGAVEAGVDLTAMGEDNITYDESANTYTVTLPHPELTSCRIDYIRQYDRSFTTCNVDWDEARLLASYAAISNFRDSSIEGGVLERAQNEARLVIANFITLVTGAEVDVEFMERDESLRTVPSCTPVLPAGWQVDPTTGQWLKVS